MAHLVKIGCAGTNTSDGVVETGSGRVVACSSGIDGGVVDIARSGINSRRAATIKG